MVSTFLALKGVLWNFWLLRLKLVSPQWQSIYYSLLPALLPGLLSDLLHGLLLDLISTVCCFGFGWCSVLHLCTLSPWWWRAHCLQGFLTCFTESGFHISTIKEPDFINVLSTPGRVLVLGFICPGEGSNCSTVLDILPDVLFPDPDEPVVVDNVVSSVILKSGLDSFCVLVLILYSLLSSRPHPHPVVSVLVLLPSH